MCCWPAGPGKAPRHLRLRIARSCVRATDEAMESGRISDATWAECERHVESVEARLELLAAIGNWRMFSRLLLTLRIPLEDGLEDWMPDGLRPARAPHDF